VRRGTIARDAPLTALYQVTVLAKTYVRGTNEIRVRLYHSVEIAHIFTTVPDVPAKQSDNGEAPNIYHVLKQGGHTQVRRGLLYFTSLDVPADSQVLQPALSTKLMSCDS
jgi:hypothetical protein